MLILTGFKPELAPYFAALNYQWIEEYFDIEAEDRKALDDPYGYALAAGGEILFLCDADQVVGTAAMVPKFGDDEQQYSLSVESGVQAAIEVFELAKMAVAASLRGQGLGRIIIDGCIQFARSRGAKRIVLTSNDILKPAMALYEGAGFKHYRDRSDARYARGNVFMQLDF